MKKVFLIALIALVFMAGVYAEEKTTDVTWDLSTDETNREWGFYTDDTLSTADVEVALTTNVDGSTVTGSGTTYVGYKIIGPAVTIKLYANSALTINGAGSGDPIHWTGTLTEGSELENPIIGGEGKYGAENAITILDESSTSGTPPTTALRTDHYLLTVNTVGNAADKAPGNYSAVMTLVLEPVEV